MVRTVRAYTAFTLIELLTVIAVIAVLLAILLPSLTKAMAAAQLLKCESNLRQLGMATQMYANDYGQTLPFSNWNPVQTFSNADEGWLYTPPMSTPPSANDVMQGALYPYLATTQVFHCPVYDPGDSGAIANVQTNVLTTYIMNGAVNGYGATISSVLSSAGFPPVYLFKITQFQSDDVLMWECDERGTAAWEDGSSYPTETYNPYDPYFSGSGARHGRKLCMLSMDGHVETIGITDYWALASSAYKNRLWCRPDTATGR